MGGSGAEVSTVGLGTMTWGRDTERDEAFELLQQFTDAGGTLIDTASTYSGGAAEQIIGEALASQISRDQVVIASKSGTRGGRINASRLSLLDSLDSSLQRLGTDHLDFWFVQSLDLDVDPAEVADALEYAVTTGRTRYVGVGNYPGWALSELATRLAGPRRLAAAHMEYSLLQRGIEREVAPACSHHGLGVFAWSALGRGVLTGKYRHTIPADSRAASPHLRGFVEPYLNDEAGRVVEAIAIAAEGLGVSPLDVALAWVRHRNPVACAIVGARTPAQLSGILTGVDLLLPEEIITALDDVTAPELGYPEI